VSQNKNHSFAEKINQDNFSKLIEAHTLIQAGDIDAGQEIMKELGIERPGMGNSQERGHGSHHGLGMNRNR